jgi:hypothetical protein
MYPGRADMLCPSVVGRFVPLPDLSICDKLVG